MADALTVLAQIRAEMEARGVLPETAEKAARDMIERRAPSRFVGERATAEFAKGIAGGGLPTGFAAHSRDVRGSGVRERLPLSKALAQSTQSAGGVLVPVEVAQEIQTLLRARSAVSRLKPKRVPVERQLDVPSISSGATAFWVSENAAIPTSEQTFAIAATLRPRKLGQMVPVSNSWLRNASPEGEDAIQSDMAETLALEADRAYLMGSGASGQPLGLANTPGLTAGPDLGPDGRAPTFDDLKLMVAALRDRNAPFGSPGWVLAPRSLSTLERLKTSTGEYLGDRPDLLSSDPAGGGGKLLGLPFVTSTQVPVNQTRGTSTDASWIALGSDWSDACWIGESLALTLEASREASYTPDGGTTWLSAYQNDQTLFRVLTETDIAFRRPTLFTVMTGVRP